MEANQKLVHVSFSNWEFGRILGRIFGRIFFYWIGPLNPLPQASTNCQSHRAPISPHLNCLILNLIQSANVCTAGRERSSYRTVALPILSSPPPPPPSSAICHFWCALAKKRRWEKRPRGMESGQKRFHAADMSGNRVNDLRARSWVPSIKSISCLYTDKSQHQTCLVHVCWGRRWIASVQKISHHSNA